MVTIRQAKQIVKQWVTGQASQAPGFCGAFFHGSINEMAEDDWLPAASDVDVILVLEGPIPPEKPGKLSYQGVIVDASYLPLEEVHSAEQVLGVPHLAGSLRSDCVIADTTGLLRAVQAGVAREFASRAWVTRRCEYSMGRVRRNLAWSTSAGFQGAPDRAEPEPPFHDQVIAWLFGVGVTTHVLLAAGLKNLTVRKRYLAVRELLREVGREDYYESLLEMLGCAWMDRAQVERHLPGLESAFDAARGVIRSPFPFAGDISQTARLVAIDGSRELIERGDHREAVFWMAVTWSRCQKVFLEDGQAGSFARHAAGWRSLLADLGIRAPADVQRRSRQVLERLPEVWQVAQEIIQKNPKVG